MEAMVNGVRLFHEVAGEGEPLLLVHGFPLSGQLWDGIVERLRGEFRLIVPDLRGLGRSEFAEPATLRDHADDLAALLDELGERRPVVVVGLSMGGYVAFEFVRRHRRRVRALVLVDSRAQPDTPEGVRGRHEMAERALREGSAAVADGMVDRLFAPSAPPALKEEWRARMAATPAAGAAAALLAMADRPDARPLLRRFARPTLVVVGAEDLITPPGEARTMAEAARAGRLVVVPGAGHMTPVERPDELAAALRDFVRSLP